MVIITPYLYSNLIEELALKIARSGDRVAGKGPQDFQQ